MIIFILERKYVQVSGASMRHAQCTTTVIRVEGIFSHTAGLQLCNALTWSHSGPCSVMSQMSRSHPSTSCLHGCWVSTNFPLRVSRRGQVWCKVSAPFPHTCVLITAARSRVRSRVQTIYQPSSTLQHHSHHPILSWPSASLACPLCLIAQWYSSI